MLGDPLEALHYARAGVAVAFMCPLSMARDTKGFSFAADGWHPWVAEIQEQDKRENPGYQGSLLERYYDRFRPQTALEALPGLDVRGPCGLGELASDLFWLTPWWPTPAEELHADVRDWLSRGAHEHGFSSFDLRRDGSPYHGPVSRELGEVEFRRLRNATRALREHGYDRSHGDSLFYLVRRGGDLRAVKFGSGYHRTAAMAALGRDAIPAQLRPPLAVDVDDVNDWPQVRSGMWSRQAAIDYVDHLFDFDSMHWARIAGLA